MARRTKEEAQATRSHILDSAEQVFERRGVSRTSLHEVAVAAGVTRGAIYWHFKDKADLFNAMMLRVSLPMEASLQRGAADADREPLEHLRQSLLRALKLAATDSQVRRVLEIATHKVEYVDELQAARERKEISRGACLEIFERELRLAMRRGQIGRRMPARAAAMGLYGLVDGLLRSWLWDPTAFDLVKFGRQALDTYLAGLAAPAAKPANEP